MRTERLDFSLVFARETDTVATLVMSEIQCGWRGNFYLVLHSQILISFTDVICVIPHALPDIIIHGPLTCLASPHF